MSELSELLSFKVPSDLLKFAEQVAEEEGISVSAVARRDLLRERAARLAKRPAKAVA